MCTVLAGDNIQYAQDVLGLLFHKLDHAPLAFHLPLLYVWDSILYNIGGRYVELSVREVCVSLFPDCGIGVRTGTRLNKLAKTWLPAPTKVT